MEDICNECTKSAKVSCCCNNLLRFCSDCYLFAHKKFKGIHEPLDLKILKINQKLNSTLEGLYKVKSQLVSKSNQLIDIIKLITTKKLSLIEKYIETCIQASETDTENLFKDYQNMKIREAELEEFRQIANKNLLFFKDNSLKVDPEDDSLLKNAKAQKNYEIIDTKVENLTSSIELKSIKLSKNSEKVKKQLQTNLFLEGQTSTINSLAVTYDKKYIVSCCFNDNKIRI